MYLGNDEGGKIRLRPKLNNPSPMLGELSTMKFWLVPLWQHASQFVRYSRHIPTPVSGEVRSVQKPNSGFAHVS